MRRTDANTVLDEEIERALTPYAALFTTEQMQMARAAMRRALADDPGVREMLDVLAAGRGRRLPS